MIKTDIVDFQLNLLVAEIGMGEDKKRQDKANSEAKNQARRRR